MIVIEKLIPLLIWHQAIYLMRDTILRQLPILNSLDLVIIQKIIAFDVLCVLKCI